MRVRWSHTLITSVWILLLVIGACALDASVVHGYQDSWWKLGRVSFEDFYGTERSETLPGAQGQERSYRWSEPKSTIRFWPRLASYGDVRLEYLVPFGQATLQLNNYPAYPLPEAPQLRTLHVLVPSNQDLLFTLAQTQPQGLEGRSLGLIVGDVRWAGLGAVQNTGRLLLGIPFTLVLCALVIVCQSRKLRWWLGIPSAVLLLFAILAQTFPWDIRAMQASIQGLLLVSLIAIGLLQALKRWPIQRWHIPIYLVWLLSLLMFLNPDISSDGVGYYAYVRSAFIDGDLNFSNEFSAQESPFPHIPKIIPSARPGYLVNAWSIGPAMYWTPFWLLAHGITKLGIVLGLPWQANGYAPPYLALIAFASSLGGLVCMLASYALVRRWVSPAIASLAAITAFVGSHLWYYSFFGGSFAHILVAAAVALVMLASQRLIEQPSLSRWLQLGLAIGLQVVNYWMTAILLLVPMAYVVRLLWQTWQQGRWPAVFQQLRWGILAAFLALLVFFPQMLSWKLINGLWITIPQGSTFATPQDIHLLSALFGPLYGLAWWTPALFLGICASCWFAWRKPWPGAILLVAVIAFLLYNVSLIDWHGSGGFGMRRLTPLVPLVTLGLAFAAQQLRRWPVVLVSIASATMLWSVSMTIRYFVYLLPHPPFTIRSLGLRGILYASQPYPLDSALFVIGRGWFGVLARTGAFGSVLIAMCTSIVMLILLALFRWLALRQNSHAISTSRQVND